MSARILQILVTSLNCRDCPPAMALLRAVGCALVVPDGHRVVPEDELGRLVGDCDAVVAGIDPFTARVLSAAPRLKVIARTGVGYDAVDVEAATALGILVTNAPGSNAISVAEHAMGLMWALLRHGVALHNSLVAGRWQRIVGTELADKTLGVVGLGNIGKQVAVRARAFGMAVIATDPVRYDDFAAQHGVRYVPLDELLRTADIVTLHAPLDATTHHLIGHAALALMKPTAYLVNTARGGIVDEDALVAALQMRRIAGAALDVFEEEPLRHGGFGALDNVVLSPHIAGITKEAIERMAFVGVQTVLAALRGERPQGIVNPDVWEHRRR
ncbi:MAG: phosphoglycerate dehydrogenase [Chloroflexi bacterium]|nr:phosphoglycerate dehydrogenase [Chloroflexota bacterium]